jgi:hypothetical protein
MAKKFELEKFDNEKEIQRNLEQASEEKMGSEEVGRELQRLLEIFTGDNKRKSFRCYEENAEFFKDFSFHFPMSFSDSVQVAAGLMKEGKIKKGKDPYYIASLKNSLGSDTKMNISCFLPSDCIKYLSENVHHGLYVADSFMYLQKLLEQKFGKVKKRPSYAK